MRKGSKFILYGLALIIHYISYVSLVNWTNVVCLMLEVYEHDVTPIFLYKWPVLLVNLLTILYIKPFEYENPLLCDVWLFKHRNALTCSEHSSVSIQIINLRNYRQFSLDLTSRSRILLGKLIVVQQAKKFPYTYRFRTSVTVSRIPPLVLRWATWIQSSHTVFF